MSVTRYMRPYDIRVSDRLGDGNEGTQIRFWCLTNDSKPALLRCEDHTYFFRMELPTIVKGSKMHWTPERANTIYTWLCKCLKDDAPIAYKLKEYSKLYYYQDKTPFIVLFFTTSNAMRHCSNFLKKERDTYNPEFGVMKFPCWEVDVDVVRKLLTIKKQNYTQWFKTTADKIDNDDERRISKAGNKDRPAEEYLVGWRDIIPCTAEECKDFIEHPRLLGYDFETYTDNHKIFPDPYNPKHCIFNISCIGIDDKDPNSKIRASLMLGKAPAPENCIHIETETEVELLNEFEKFIDEYDPDVTTGYNIFGFDNEYYSARKKINAEKPSNFTRLKDGVVNVETRKWRSAGFGHNIVTIIDCEGRISVDMLVIIKREHKLSKYTLSFVSQYFLKKDKHDVTPKQMFVSFEQNQKAIKRLKKKPDSQYANRLISSMTPILEYCLQDSELSIELFIKLNTWISLVEMSAVVGVTIVSLFTRGQQVRTFSLIYDLAWHKGFVITKRDFPILPYMGAFVFVPIKGLHDNVICEDFSGLYPSIIIAHNLCYTTLVRPQDQEIELAENPDNFIVTEYWQVSETDKKKRTEETETEELDDNDYGQVGEDDFSDSDSENEEEPEEEEKEEVVVDIDDDALDPDKKYNHYKFIWVKPHIREGLMPRMMRNLVSERSAAKRKLADTEDELENETDPIKINLLQTQKIIYDKRQLALKVTANSGYGFMGAQTAGMLPLIEAAITITQLGQRYIKRCVRYLTTKYCAIIIYGDTDSVMFIIPGVIGGDCDVWGKRLAEELSELFPPPMKVEFEKAMRMLSFTKKRYASYLIKADGSYVLIKGTDMPYILVRGITIARRDNCRLLVDTYTDLLRCILDNKGIVHGYSIIIAAVLKLLKGEVDPIKELSVVKTINAQYKSQTCQMKVFADKLSREGKPQQPGTRASYLVLADENDNTNQAKRLGEKMILDEDYDPDEHKIDLVYYLTRLLQKPLDQLFSNGFMEQLPMLNRFIYNPKYFKGNKQSKDIYTPVEMICLLIQDGMKGEYSLRKICKNVQRLDTQFKRYYESMAK